MDKPCYYSYVVYDKPTGDCSIDKCCFRDEQGRKWESCDAGKLHVARLKKRSQAKLTKARKMSREIVKWAKSSRVQPYEPGFMGQMTKIIKKHL